MAASVPEQEETLGQLLAERARERSDGSLARDVIAAFVTALAIAVWRGPLWDIRIALAGCFVAFGLWGLADRDLERETFARRPMFVFLRLTRVVAATLGFGAAAYLALSLLGRIIGRVIS